MFIISIIVKSIFKNKFNGRFLAAGNYKLWQKLSAVAKKLADPDIQRWLRGLKEEVCTEMSASEMLFLWVLFLKITVRNLKNHRTLFKIAKDKTLEHLLINSVIYEN